MINFINKNGFIIGIVFIVSISILIKISKAWKHFYVTAEARLKN